MSRGGFLTLAQFLQISLTIVGLTTFEIVSSLDNAVVNAEVLGTMSARARRWFLLWGILIAVFVVRGGLPWLIVWATSPGVGPGAAFFSTLSGDPSAARNVQDSAPILLVGGGIFLLFLFCHWIFLEPKEFGLWPERFIQRQGVWFYAVVSLLLAAVVWLSIHRNVYMAFAAVVGSTVFFITHGFRQNAELAERRMMTSGIAMADVSKLLYLEAIDASFSIDGVLGAFAFTLSVPLILAGNGLGAVVLRWLTVANIERIKRYRLVKNGAMYSIAILGSIMLIESFGGHVPSWIAPVSTLLVIGYFIRRAIKQARELTTSSEHPASRAPSSSSPFNSVVPRADSIQAARARSPQAPAVPSR